MDPDLAEAHVSLAWVTAWYDYDFLAAEREFAFTGVLADTIRPSNRLVSLGWAFGRGAEDPGTVAGSFEAAICNPIYYRPNLRSSEG